MKKILFATLICILFIVSCEEPIIDEKEYKFLIYRTDCQNSEKPIPDTLKWWGYGENRFFLEQGDLVHYSSDHNNKSLISGISRFEVYSIIPLNKLKTN